MLSLHLQTVIIHSDAELAQVHLRLDALLAANAFDSPEQDTRNEAEVLTALLYYYEQRPKRPGDAA